MLVFVGGVLITFLHDEWRTDSLVDRRLMLSALE